MSTDATNSRYQEQLLTSSTFTVHWNNLPAKFLSDGKSPGGLFILGEKLTRRLSSDGGDDSVVTPVSSKLQGKPEIVMVIDSHLL